MCTAATYRTKDHYFGRTLDVDFPCSQRIAVAPRRFPFRFRGVTPPDRHYAMIGMAFIQDGCPLYYDATNEMGLSMAGLNFPGNACCHPVKPGMDNVAPHELIPWLLGQCSTVNEAKVLLDRLNVADLPFSDTLPLATLHWMLADRERAVVVESVEEGLRVYDNPAGVMTNNPPFPYQQLYLSEFMNLTSRPPVNRLSPDLELTPYSCGFGAIGLPGDLSSTSRFVRAAFTRANSLSGDSETESVAQFFHILGSVTQARGCDRTDRGCQTTVYTSCCNTDKGIYYYNTYNNSQLSAVDLRREELDSDRLITYPMQTEQRIYWQN